MWIADPDWRPDVSTIDKSHLNIREYDVFRFTIVDRSGITTRQCDWLLRHRAGLAMRYHLHEVRCDDIERLCCLYLTSPQIYYVGLTN